MDDTTKAPTPPTPADWQAASTIKWSPYIPGTPSTPQHLFLWLPHREAMYGGAGGGGKSWAMLAGALQWVDVPNYSALLLRRTYGELAMRHGLMDMAHEWLHATAAHWDEETKTYTFPSGATVTFGFLEHRRDRYRYQGPWFQYIGIDEITQMPFDDYQWLFTRQRRLVGMPVPVRTRVAGNPPEPDQHDWPRTYFVEAGPREGRPFIPAQLEDNPHLDASDYDAGLRRAGTVRYRQVRWGDWTVQAQGNIFAVEQLKELDRLPTAGVIWRARGWDKAATAGAGAYTVGGRLSKVSRALYGVEYVIEDIVRGQWASGERERIMQAVAGLPPADPTWPPLAVYLPIVDTARVLIRIEQEPASGGKDSAQASAAGLAGRQVKLVRPSVDKLTRARAFAAQVELGNVGLVRAPWNAAYRDELAAVPFGVYWDQVDVSSMLFNEAALVRPRPAQAVAGGAPVERRGWRPA